VSEKEQKKSYAAEDLFTGLFEKTMASFHRWLDGGSREAHDPEATAQLRKALLELWPALFREFFGRYLNLPPLGPAREAQQKILEAVDAHGRLMKAVGEFLNDFSDPFFQSFTRLPAILEDGDRRIESADDLYQAMRAVFDTQYQAYLGSPKGVRQVAALVDGYLEFKKRLDEAVAPALKLCGLPTKQEMDEIYSRLHRLKKSQREQRARLRRQESAIEELQRQVLTLRSAACGVRKPVQKRKTAPAAKQKRP
jgi:hypothetical protein